MYRDLEGPHGPKCPSSADFRLYRLLLRYSTSDSLARDCSARTRTSYSNCPCLGISDLAVCGVPDYRVLVTYSNSSSGSNIA